ncbi:hypothetical protein RRG08_061600 [Elysia crispata]|uniref:Uncharacterized protein n=1 Tax=Elysia crispata TaxID=231223 RepID=A0AAE1D4J5_9GAST|nr:hypothetical protein RRG08_061600 [Elysia crispata]
MQIYAVSASVCGVSQSPRKPGVSCYWCPTLTDNRGACPPRGATEGLILLTPFHVQMLCLDLESETRYIGGGSWQDRETVFALRHLWRRRVQNVFQARNPSSWSYAD